MSAYSMVLLYTSRFASFRKYCKENDIDVVFTKPLLKREIGFPPHLLKSIPTAFILAIFKQTKYLKARLEKFDSKKGSIETHKKDINKALLPRVEECLEDSNEEDDEYVLAKALCKDFMSKYEKKKKDG